MQSIIVVVSNNTLSSMSYVAALNGYGCAVHDTHTIGGARILLRAHLIPDLIVVDMKFHTAETDEFIQFVRDEMHLHSTRIVLVGKSTTDEQPYADAILARPVHVTDLIERIQ